MADPIVVLKFGSSVLEDHDAVPAAVLEIYREVRRGRRVVAVVSAVGNGTDDLLATARVHSDEPDPSCLARLLETGEAQAAAVMGLALDRAGIPARVLDAVQIGLRTRGELLDAAPEAFDMVRVRQELMAWPVVVVPGFSGRTPGGEPALLGRGGSDLTALFLARGLRAAECRLLKDVDGLLRVRDDGSLDLGTRYAEATWGECVRVGSVLVQPKAVEYAAGHGLAFTIARCGSGGGTVVGGGANRFEGVDPAPAPTRVVLGGLGTVGLGVFRWLRGLPGDFEVVSILVSDPGRPRPCDVPADLLTDSVPRAMVASADLVIEAIGGTGAAADLVRAARRRGCPVVSANKELLSTEADLAAAVVRGDNALGAAASVGGSLPALESVGVLSQQEKLVAVEGILNGTCNYILDRVHEGLTVADALAEAQAKGLAEADPELDISGRDSVHKLALLAGRAFGVPMAVADIGCQGLEGATAARLREAARCGGELKLVARARRSPDGVTAEVGLVVLEPHHPLYACRRENNRLVVETAGHRRLVSNGRGAGRWPTTAAVLADAQVCRRHALAAAAAVGQGKARAS